jgi:hypothetical protein
VPRAATLVRAGVAGFLALVAVEHALRPDLPPAEHFVSEYARGSTAPLQAVAFASWAVAAGACAVLAARARPGGRRVARATAVNALTAAAAGLVLATAFTTQTVAGELPVGVQRTTGGRLHDVGTLLVLGGLVLAGVASLRIVRSWRYRAVAVGLGIALLAVVPVLVALRLDAPGIGQRGFILVGCAWQLAFAGATADRSGAAAGRRGTRA